MSPTRLCGTGHTSAQEFPSQQRGKKSGQILLSSMSMRETLTCRILCQLVFSVRAVRAGKNACFSKKKKKKKLFHRCRPQRRDRNAVLPFVFDDDDDGRTWLGDTDFFHASDGHRWRFHGWAATATPWSDTYRWALWSSHARVVMFRRPMSKRFLPRLTLKSVPIVSFQKLPVQNSKHTVLRCAHRQVPETGPFVSLGCNAQHGFDLH